MNLDKLFDPFKPSLVSWRIGAMAKQPNRDGKKQGRALAYIDARDVMRRLDDVCGPANWQCRYPHANGKTICEIGIKIGSEWVWKANGAGDTDIEAEKGAISDAFKRAAVLWGIGRYLYDLDSPWVEVNDFKQIEKHEHARLEKILAGARIEMPETPAPKKPKASEKAIAAYVETFKLALDRCQFESEVLQLWKQGTEARATLGVTKGDATYEHLATLCQAKNKSFDQPQAQAAE